MYVQVNIVLVSDCFMFSWYVKILHEKEGDITYAGHFSVSNLLNVCIYGDQTVEIFFFCTLPGCVSPFYNIFIVLYLRILHYSDASAYPHPHPLPLTSTSKFTYCPQTTDTFTYIFIVFIYNLLITVKMLIRKLSIHNIVELTQFPIQLSMSSPKPERSKVPNSQSSCQCQVRNLSEAKYPIPNPVVNVKSETWAKQSTQFPIQLSMSSPKPERSKVPNSQSSCQCQVRNLSEAKYPIPNPVVNVQSETWAKQSTQFPIQLSMSSPKPERSKVPNSQSSCQCQVWNLSEAKYPIPNQVVNVELETWAKRSTQFPIQLSVSSPKPERSKVPNSQSSCQCQVRNLSEAKYLILNPVVNVKSETWAKQSTQFPTQLSMSSWKPERSEVPNSQSSCQCQVRNLSEAKCPIPNPVVNVKSETWAKQST